jgi:hypothetical protein
LAQGAALYRAGRAAEAAEKLRQAAGQKAGPEGRALPMYLLALACHALGRADEARQWLEAAGKEEARAAGQFGPVPWPRRAEWRLLRGEAGRRVGPAKGRGP